MKNLSHFDVNPYFVNGQNPITVSVIGAGGTGSFVMSRLARLHKALNFMDHPGFYVKLIDYDKVEEQNVGRQLFTSDDVGFYKAERIVSKINIAYDLAWKCSLSDHPDDINKNLIISCVDNTETKQRIIDDFYSKVDEPVSEQSIKYYLIDCGNGKDFGQVILSDVNKKLKNINDFFGRDLSKFDTKERQGDGCSYRIKLEEQDLFINDLVSIYAVNIIKDLIINKRIYYQGVFFNTTEFLTNKIFIQNE